LWSAAAEDRVERLKGLKIASGRKKQDSETIKHKREILQQKVLYFLEIDKN